MPPVDAAKARAAAAWRLRENGMRMFQVRAIVLDRDDKDVQSAAVLRVLITVRWSPGGGEWREEAMTATLVRGRLQELARGWV